MTVFHIALQTSVTRFRHKRNSLHLTMLDLKSSNVYIHELKIHEAKTEHATELFSYAQSSNLVLLFKERLSRNSTLPPHRNLVSISGRLRMLLACLAKVLDCSTLGVKVTYLTNICK